MRSWHEPCWMNTIEDFQERNPNLRVFSAHLHMDEATPHLHIDFVPFTTGSKRGLDTRVSLKQALAAQGFKGGTRGATEWAQWVQSEKEQLAAVMERYDIQWEQKGTHEKHLSVSGLQEAGTGERDCGTGHHTGRKAGRAGNGTESDRATSTRARSPLSELEQRLETDAEFQLPEPPALMTSQDL